MARKSGRKGGSSAARSAAAKKGWETRRRGGAKPKPAATKRTAASKPKATAKRGGMPKTTSARGRALTNQRRAADLVRASRGGRGPSAKAVRSVLTAQRARAFYAATGGGKKRSAVKPAGKKATAAKAAAVRSRLGGGGSARAKVAGRPRAGAKAARRLSGMGRAPATRLPAANSDAYKYNKAGLLASPQERSRMRGRDRAREKNAALAQQQAAGQRRAERQAARRLTSDRTQPMSVLRNSPTFNAAERAVQRRSKRADENFRQSFQLERQKSALTSKALKMQQQAAERKAQGKKVTQTMESNFQQLRRQLAKVDRSLTTRRKALDVVRSQSERMTINTRERSRY